MEKRIRAAAVIISSLGVLLWLINWWANRPLFLDEANVARNVYELRFSDFFTGPLRYRQYAAPLYLAAAKASGEVFGYGERALRLPALLGALLSVYGLWRAGRSLRLGWWSVLPLALLAANPTVLRYAGEVKPYAVDLGVAALLLSLAVDSKRRPAWQWALLGTTAIWLSLPAVFVLTGVGLVHFLCIPRARPKKATTRWRWIAAGMTWVLAFAGLYLLVLRPSVGSKYLQNYHGEWFFPLPGADYPWRQLVEILLALAKTIFGFTAFSIGLGTLTVVAGLALASRRLVLLLFAPFVAVLIASAFGYYSLLPRLLLFLMPGSWLLAALGCQRVANRIGLTGWARLALPFLWVFVVGSTNVVRHFWSPLSFSDSRQLVAGLGPDQPFTPVLHEVAVPVYSYYGFIHPHRPTNYPVLGTANIREQIFPGKYVLIYDVLTKANIRLSMQQDIQWATERGCQVKTEAMFRAARVYCSCPPLFSKDD